MIKTIILTALMFGALVGNSTGQTDEVNEMLRNYYNLTSSLVSENGHDAQTHAVKMKKTAENFPVTSLGSRQQKIWNKHIKRIHTTLDRIGETTAIESQRNQLDRLSTDLFSLLEALGGNSSTVYLSYCPMKKTHWLSDSPVIKNPYYGKKMLSCGSVIQTLN